MLNYVYFLQVNKTMKFSYRFSNLLGTVYCKGNVLFSKDGNSLISPIGNKINVYNLKDNKSAVLPIESRFNIRCIALSPCGRILIAVNEGNQGVICSLVSKTVLHHHYFLRHVQFITYSPDGRYVAVAIGNEVVIHNAPGTLYRQFHTFQVVRTIRGFHDKVKFICWSSNSQVLAACSYDMTTRIICMTKSKKARVCCLGAHMDIVSWCFFEKNSLNLYTIGRNGGVVVWQSSLGLDGLVDDDEDGEQNDDDDDEEEQPVTKRSRATDVWSEEMSQSDEVLSYEKVNAYSAMSTVKGEDDQMNVKLSAAAYHDHMRVLVTGYSNGAFLLHEMPDFNMIHSLTVNQQCISTLCFNTSGDWIALGCSDLGQLVVWEWQSETYVMKQQGHFNNMSCLTFSPDGQNLVTGGDDGKVKVWNTFSGFCYVTFNEHTSGVSCVSFGKKGTVVVSASLDGTVRAFDLNRYRNFRTFTSPRPTQFSSLAIDSSGEIVCAGGHDVFEIFVWSMQTGRLLDIMSGHKAPIGELSFSSSTTILVSASWDKAVRVWDVFVGKNKREVVEIVSDATTVTFRPDGSEFAVATVNGYITFFEIRNMSQTGSIEGRNDLGSGRSETALVKAKQTQKAKFFLTLCYTADGECILAAGQSKNVCIYHVRQQILLKKFVVTMNLSLDAVSDMYNKRKMTEFGNMALVERRDQDDRSTSSVAISLPGVKKGDMASRSSKPEVRVTCVRFSPTGRSWAAATTEGLLFYSLDNELVFDPLELETDVTTSAVRKAVVDQEHSKALMMALKLKEHKLVEETVENIAVDEIKLVSSSLPERYVERLVAFLSEQLESSPHLEFYLIWAETLLMNHGQRLKDRSMQIITHLHSLQRTLIMKRQHFDKICDFNKYTLQYVISRGKSLKQQKVDDETTGNTNDDELENGEALFADDDDDDDMDAELMT